MRTFNRPDQLDGDDDALPFANTLKRGTNIKQILFISVMEPV